MTAFYHVSMCPHTHPMHPMHRRVKCFYFYNYASVHANAGPSFKELTTMLTQGIYNNTGKKARSARSARNTRSR